MKKDIAKLNAQLFKQCYLGNINNIEDLIKEGANLNQDNLFLMVVKRGKLDLVEYCVNHGVDIHQEKETALIAACENGNLPIVKFLVEQGAKINVDKSQPLITSYEHNKFKIMEYLLKEGAKADARNNYLLKTMLEKDRLRYVELIYPYVDQGLIVDLIHEDNQQPKEEQKISEMVKQWLERKMKEEANQEEERKKSKNKNKP